MNVIDKWLRSDGWVGIGARVGCELLFFVIVINVEHLASWAEQWVHHRILIASASRLRLVQQIAFAVIFIGFLVEICNALKLLLRKRRRKEAQS